jgi:hypothetical protein
MCVFDRQALLSLTSLFNSTNRLPFSIRTASQPLRVPVPSSHADISGSRLRPPPRQTAHDNAYSKESVDLHEARPERYEIVRFKPTMAVYG